MKPAVNAKAYFTSKDRHVFQGSPVELWRGYFQCVRVFPIESIACSVGHRSVRPTIGRLLINIDTTVAPLYVFVIGLSIFTDALAASPQAASSILC